MQYLIEYVRANARVPFGIEPLNEVDLCAFAALPYLNLGGIITERIVGGEKSLKEAAELFSNLAEANHAVGLFIPRDFTDLLVAMGRTERYGNVRCFGRRHIFDEETEQQFDALSFVLPDGRLLVTIAGTDDTLLGWKEDLNLGCNVHIAGQFSAVKYLNEVLAAREGNFLICGYSKGGNLAVYAAAMCDAPERLERLYDYDGPGFPKTFLESEAFLNVSDRCLLIAPRYSAVSMMLENLPHYVVTRGTMRGLFQHYCNRWEVEGNRFRREPDFSMESKRFHAQFMQLLSDTTVEERKLTIETAYALAKCTGARTLTDLWQERLSYLHTLTHAFQKLDKETRAIVTRLLRRFARMIAENYTYKR